MKKILLVAAVASLALSACSEPSVEEQFFNELDNRLAELEALTEQERVCLSRVMEVSGGADDDKLMALGEQMEAKHGNELPAEYESRMQDLAERTQELTMKLMPKMNPDC